MRNVISYAALSSQSERRSQSRKMKTSIVICVCLFVVWTKGESPPPPPPSPPPKPTPPAPGGPPQDSNIDKDCLTAPPEGVDPMTCCQLPELLDPKHIDDCEKKVYGSTQAADDQRNDTPFAPHIRVKISILWLCRCIEFVHSIDDGSNGDDDRLQCLAECIFNETGIMKERMFHPEVTIDLAKKALGPKQNWVPVVEDAVNVCNEHGSSWLCDKFCVFDSHENSFYFLFSQQRKPNTTIRRHVDIWQHFWWLVSTHNYSRIVHKEHGRMVSYEPMIHGNWIIFFFVCLQPKDAAHYATWQLNVQLLRQYQHKTRIDGHASMPPQSSSMSSSQLLRWIWMESNSLLKLKFA